MSMRRFVALAWAALWIAGCSPSEQQRATSTAEDAFIEAQVHAKIAAIDPATVTLVSVDVNHRVVTLTGQVHSADERVKVDAAVRSISAVTKLVDRLKVNSKAPTANEVAADLELQAKIKAALGEQTGVNALRVAVSVHNGVVTLDGEYSSKTVHALILETVHGVTGVKRVIDHLHMQK